MVTHSHMPHVLIFTDLDGTLLDDQTYDLQPALPALKRIRSWGIPLILTSSKTRAEIECYWNSLSLESPFIAENGGALYFPASFPLPAQYSCERIDAYQVVFIGRPLTELYEKIQRMKAKFGFRCFSEMSVEEIAAVTGLKPEQARLASRREFDEPVVLEGTFDERELVCKKATELGLDCVYGGRFIHLYLGGNKGRAVEIMLDIYRQLKGPVFSIGLGDGPNDVPMLKAVDKAVLMQDPDGGHIEDFAHSDLVKAKGRGPNEWNRAVLGILEELFS
jgi:mannosyl-3-phosphoglycerate phosphatase family protein